MEMKHPKRHEYLVAAVEQLFFQPYLDPRNNPPGRLNPLNVRLQPSFMASGETLTFLNVVFTLKELSTIGYV
jgi:hypothetical protein